jgi:hypothetical protein
LRVSGIGVPRVQLPGPASVSAASANPAIKPAAKTPVAPAVMHHVPTFCACREKMLRMV